MVIFGDVSQEGNKQRLALSKMKNRWSLFCLKAWTIVLLSTVSVAGFADPADKAYKIFNRLNGVPPDKATLEQMTKLVTEGKLKEAAMAAVTHPSGNFYNLTVFQWAATFANAKDDIKQPLNDFVATIMGFVMDELPFDQILSADIVYTSNVPNLPPYSLSNNQHYTQLEASPTPIHSTLVKQTQSSLNGLPPEAIAGLFSTRGFGEAYYSAGTNRRAIAFTLKNFLCNDMEALADNTRPDLRVRKDVERAPGKDPKLYVNRCKGCHAGMDPLAGAFAFYDWEVTTANPPVSTLRYFPGSVRPKVFRNPDNQSIGHHTVDDSWFNNWLEGRNSRLGWQGAVEGKLEGKGAASLGQMLTKSDEFSKCMASHAVRLMCVRKILPQNKNDVEAVTRIADDFKKTHNLKEAFTSAAIYCAD